MREQLKKLAGVQELDTRIGALTRRLEAIDDGSVLAGKIAAAEAQIERLLAKRDEKTMAQRQVEDEAERVQQKLDKEKQRLEAGDVSGHRDVMDLQRHIQSLGQHLLSVDEKLHDLITKANADTAKLTELEGTLAKARRKLGQIRQKHAADSTDLQAEVARLEVERNERAATVDEALMARYDSIRVRTEDNRALVTLREPICVACGTAIPMLMFDRLLISDDMALCENCGRILIRLDNGASAAGDD